MFVPLVILLFLLLGARNSRAQRPANASTCDYYAETLYGENTTTTQTQLIEGIVALAFGGGFNLSNVDSDLTGILNPGTFQNLSVDLRPWFNGSIDSTNLNNQPVGIDWLDGGGTDPLYSFLSNQTSTVVLSNSTNEYRLFTHFFLAFAHIFGCTQPPPPPPTTGGGGGGGALSLAYVHKYMNLNFTDLGHFIDQLTKSTIHFGFSEQDGETFSTQMNSLYNVRCAPPITLNPAQGPQLLSLCQASSCPLAEPNPDCAAYVNLTATGIGGGPLPSSSASSSSSSTSSLSSSSTSSAASSTSSTATAQTTTAVPASTSSSTSLSSGAIAGIAVGGAAGLLILLGAVYIFGRRHRRRSNTPGAGGMAQYDPNNPRPETTLYAPSTMTGTTAKDQHMSYASNGGGGGGGIAEMESPRFAGSPQMGRAASPHHSVQQQQQQQQQLAGYNSSRTMSPVHYQPPAELEGAGGGAGGGYLDEQQQQQQQQYYQQQHQQQQMRDWDRAGPDAMGNQGQRYG